MKPARTLLLLWVIAIVPMSIAAQASNWETILLPSQLQSFVEPGTRPIELELADLNGDGLPDFIVVLENLPTADEAHGLERVFLIIAGQPGGALRVVTRSDSAVRDDTCGGPLGDCFGGVDVKGSTFILSEGGGSNWRWNRVSTFKFSSRDKTWQLVRVVEQSWHLSNPSKIKRTVYVPPNDFGKIDISEYDPNDFLRKGSK
jgi:hypothetical protein